MGVLRCKCRSFGLQTAWFLLLSVVDKKAEAICVLLRLWFLKEYILVALDCLQTIKILPPIQRLHYTKPTQVNKKKVRHLYRTFFIYHLFPTLLQCSLVILFGDGVKPRFFVRIINKINFPCRITQHIMFRWNILDNSIII